MGKVSFLPVQKWTSDCLSLSLEFQFQNCAKHSLVSVCGYLEQGRSYEQEYMEAVEKDLRTLKKHSFVDKVRAILWKL